MILYIDAPGVNSLVFEMATFNRMYYRAQSPRRAIVRIDCGDAVTVRGCYVDASIGWDAGTTGFVLPGFQGKRHSKITIRRVVPAPNGEVQTLSEVLAAAPTEGAPRGGKS